MRQCAALKSNSSTRTRNESGEKPIADPQTKVGTGAGHHRKLSGILGGTAGIEYSASETEIAALS